MSFTCTITVHTREGSITWFSNEYIGENDRWMISEQQREATNDDTMTTAEFLPGEYRREGNCKVTMASRLQISNYSSSSVVTCSAPDERFHQSMTLQLLGKYY